MHLKQSGSSPALRCWSRGEGVLRGGGGGEGSTCGSGHLRGRGLEGGEYARRVRQ